MYINGFSMRDRETRFRVIGPITCLIVERRVAIVGHSIDVRSVTKVCIKELRIGLN